MLSEWVKPSKTYPEQLEILKGRGLVIDDTEFALSVLQRVNYYRLTGYLLRYKQPDDTYLPATSFELVYRQYEFDTELRNQLMRILERIEISMRTKISYYLGHAVSPLAHRYRHNFREHPKYFRMRRELRKELRSRNGKDAVVTHHFRKYRGRFPVWVYVEYMSFGQLSVFYSNLTDEHQRRIANGMGLTAKQLRSWLHSLVYLRNVCAHYARIYGRNLTFTPNLPTDVFAEYGNDKLFASLYVCARLCESRSEWDFFILAIQSLVDSYEGYVEVSELGFPENWFAYLRKIQRTYSSVS